MRNLVISVVVLLCVAQMGYSYQCYTCTMATSDASCTTVTNCTGSTQFCGTSVVKGVFVNWISKFCSAACINANQNLTMVSASEACCTSDLCNTQKIGDANSWLNSFGNGAPGLTSSAFLMVVLGLLSYIFAF
ncbi:prostate stem cell antigen-like [Aquarana catesbeiana]|uniref:prostate stem cell antigen-like n=1 Tax=Aquarana catesbeiana TaxID=8400 RepID=UPI003CC98D1E